MLAYLSAVVDGKLPVNNEIIALMQDMFNLLPNLNISTLSQSLTGAQHRCFCLFLDTIFSMHQALTKAQCVNLLAVLSCLTCVS